MSIFEVSDILGIIAQYLEPEDILLGLELTSKEIYNCCTLHTNDETIWKDALSHSFPKASKTVRRKRKLSYRDFFLYLFKNGCYLCGTTTKPCITFQGKNTSVHLCNKCFKRPFSNPYFSNIQGQICTRRQATQYFKLKGSVLARLPYFTQQNSLQFYLSEMLLKLIRKKYGSEAQFVEAMKKKQEEQHQERCQLVKLYSEMYNMVLPPQEIVCIAGNLSTNIENEITNIALTRNRKQSLIMALKEVAITTTTPEISVKLQREMLLVAMWLKITRNQIV